MRIAVLGSGGIGGYYGALLAKAGHDVSFVARGAHLEAMQQRGLTVSPEDMVDAALVGLDRGELVTIPGLHDGDEWTRFEAQRRALATQFGNSVPAPRYRAWCTDVVRSMNIF
jgi:short-subunit dehydrogenase